MVRRPNARTNPCPGTGIRVTRRNRKDLPNTAVWRCDACGREVPVNFNGALRWHKASVRRP